jgi:hypothetical protein
MVFVFLVLNINGRNLSCCDDGYYNNGLINVLSLVLVITFQKMLLFVFFFSCLCDFYGIASVKYCYVSSPMWIEKNHS